MNTSFVDSSLIGKRVEEIRIEGNSLVPSQQIRNQIKNTSENQPFDPAAVESDYKRIYGMRRFANVEAKVEPTRAGVIVIFVVTEEKLIRSIRFVGNTAVDSEELEKAIELKVGESMEDFQISLAKRAIVDLYRSKNYPACHVEVDAAARTRTGDLILHITQGPHVTIRNIVYVGANSFDDWTLNGQISSKTWFPVFYPGTYNPEDVEQDVAALRKFYQGKGFLDVKVGRKLVFSPDQSELQINFEIEEGVRYTVDRVTFVGNTNVPEGVLRKDLKMIPGRPFDAELVEGDVKRIVAAYAPLGYIYRPRSSDAEYLRIGKPNYPFVAKLVYHKEPGSVELVWEIAEGKPIHLGQVIVIGNDRVEDRVIRREFPDAQPGTLYNSAAISNSQDVLLGMPLFKPGGVTATPIGNDPYFRDLLVEVKEADTTSIGVGAKVDSNLGLGGNVYYTQSNVDILNFPTRWEDVTSGRAFTGAGEKFSASFQPGVRSTNGNVSFYNPYIFDQPYSFGAEAHYTQFYREWGDDERRAGGSFTFGKQFNPNWSAAVTFEAEDVYIGGIYDYFPPQRREDVIDPVTNEPVVNNGVVQTDLRSPRALEVLQMAGHNTVTDVALTVRRDDTNHGVLKYQGSNVKFSYYEFGALGGDFHYHQFDVGADQYITLLNDLQDRRTVLDLHLDSGYITTDAPFFNRFYGGGRGSLRGFEYRGVGPRSGRALDPIGGDFELLGSAEINFPVYKDVLRGVVFTDLGTIEPGIQIKTFRQSVGAGLRVTIPQISRVPFAFDVAFPIFKGNDDIRQVFSFGVGITGP